MDCCQWNTCKGILAITESTTLDYVFGYTDMHRGEYTLVNVICDIFYCNLDSG